MSKKTPEKYAPGELEKTRKNIGPIDEEDAKEMADKLGGEVGVERSEESLDEKYKKLRYKNRRKSEILKPEKISSNAQNIIDQKPEPEPLPEVKDHRISHLQRVKINFLAARPEHQLKTRMNAFFSFFSFLTHVRDAVNPRFISQGDRIFYYRIEKFVMATRNLMSRNRKNKIMPVKNPFYFKILEIIKNWDIAGINSDLSMLQKSPRNILFPSTASLARKIFRPMFMLNELSVAQHIVPALRDVQEKSAKILAKDSPDIEKINNQFTAAKDAAYAVLIDLKKTLFPLLLKQIPSGFHEYDSFINNEFTNICQFLNISADDIIQPEEEHYAPSSEESKEKAEKEKKSQPVDIGIQIGFTLLDEMFPDAGWSKLERKPDMFPYFNKLLVLPRDMEILPPGDPLQYVIILIKVIQELLHGFRSIELKSLRLNDSIEIELSNFLEEIIRDWHLFIDETIEKHFLPQLRDFCRQMERSASFKHSDYGIKIQSTLLWMKRKLILPFYHFNDKLYSKPSMAVKNVKLFEQVSYAANIFGRILADLNKEEPRTAGNPWSKIEFEIEHPVCHRLLYVLTKNRKKQQNRNLILYTTSIILVLDYLVNSENSPLYKYEEIVHFRHHPDNVDIPEYIFRAVNPQDIWKKQEKDDTRTAKEKKDESGQSILEGYLHRSEMQSYLKKMILNFHDNGKYFCVLVTRLPADHDLTEILGESTREMQDITFYSSPALYYILLPETRIDEAEKITGRIVEKAKEKEDPVPSIVNVEYHNTWGSERLMKVLKKCEDFLIEQEEPSVWLYNNLDDNIKKYEE